MDSAEIQMLKSIDAYLAKNEDMLALPLTKVNKATAQVVENNAKSVKRITEKILRSADRETVKNDDVLNGITTGILGAVDAWLSDTHSLLSLLAAKSGLTEVGAPLETALDESVTRGKDLEYMGTLVLAVKEAVPWLDRMAVALEKIADCLCPQSSPIAPAEMGDQSELVGEAVDSDQVEPRIIAYMMEDD